MTHRKVTPKLAKEWKKLREDNLSYRAIGRLYGVKYTTIQYWIVPGYREKDLAHNKEYRIKQKEKKLRIKNDQREYTNRPEVKNRIKNYQREYRKRPEVKLRYKEQRKIYDLKYKNIVRHIDNFFPQIFNSNPELPLKEISSRIDNLTGVHLKESTLETCLNKYETKARDPPLIKTESGQYRLNPSFYGNP